MSKKYILNRYTNRMTALFLSLVIILSTANVFADVSESANSNEQKYIVKFKSESGKDKFTKDKTKSKKIKNDFKVQESVAVELTEAEARNLENDTDVMYIEPDGAVEILSVGKPDKNNDKVKNMSKGTQEIPWGIHAIGSDLMMNKYDGKKIKVAVFDTGVSPHEDLTITGGVSFVGYTSDYSDDNGHGTHIAGTIAAKDNKLGVVGAAPDAEIYAVKVLDKNGGGSYSNIIAALEWAVDNKIDIVNMSLGGWEYSTALWEAVQYATDAGIIIVAAAGNRGEGADTMTYPAKYDEVVAVGAIGENLRIASFSSRGPNLNIVAPGVSILSTANDGGYATMSGTSMAAPHVTGAFAAIKSKEKKLSANELIDKVYESVTPLGDSNIYGHGLLNAAKAVGVINEPVIPVESDDTTNSENNDTDEILPVDSTFDIISTDIRLNEYKQKLEAYSNDAFENGDLDLSKEIYSKLQELIQEDISLHSLPSDFEDLPKDSEAASVALAEINAYYSTKSSQYRSLEEQYLAALAAFEKELPVPIYPPATETDEFTDDLDKLDVELTINSIFNDDVYRLADADIEPQAAMDSPLVMKDESNSDPVLDTYAVMKGSSVNLDSDKIVIGLPNPDTTSGAAITFEENETGDAIEALATASFYISSKTSTSVTVGATFPTSGIWGNTIVLYDFNNATTNLAYTPYDGNWYKTSGTFTINGLTPGGFYILVMGWSADGTWSGGANTIHRMVHLPYSTTESLTTTYGNYVSTTIESTDKSYATSANFTTWMNRLDTAYTSLKDLTGYTPYSGSRIDIRSTRQDFNANSAYDGRNYWNVTWGKAGNPATYMQPFVRSQMKRLSSGDWSDTAIHELSHAFDNFAWNFDSEFFADFKEYYVVETQNATVYRPDTQKYYYGSGFQTFFQSDQYESYNNTFPYGYYHSRGMTAIFIRIKNTIGWQPFKDTFRYINNLSSSQAPTTHIGRFNLFITKLRDYSGKDVISYLSSNEKSVIQSALGGTIAYYIETPASTPIYLNSPVDINLSAGQYKVYKFTPTTTGKYNIFTGPYAGTGAGNDTYIELFTDAALTNRIAYNDDYDNGTTYSRFSQIIYSLNANTAYYIKVRNYSSSVGLYARLTVQQDVQAATNITLNAPIDVSLPAGEYKIFKFTPTTTGKYNIYTGPYGGTAAGNDTYLELYSDAALTNRIAYNDDYDNGTSYARFSQIIYSCNANTSYYIKLRHYGTSTGVNARLTVVQDIPIIALNSYVDVSVASGSYALYKFTPTTTGTYSFTTSPYGGGTTNSDTYLELYTDASMTNRIAYNDDYDNGTSYRYFSQIIIGLSANTSYYIKFRGYNNSAMGRLTVKSAIDPSIKLIGITSNSITISATFPLSGEAGNALRIRTSPTTWQNFSGTSSSTHNGTYKVSGLNPLTTYTCVLSWNGGSKELNILTPSKIEQVYIEELTQAKIDDMIRRGVILHTEDTTISGLSDDVNAQWAGGAHRTIAVQAGIILKGDKGEDTYNILNEEFRYNTLNPRMKPLDIVTQYAVETDNIEKDGGSYVGHFYGPDGKNYDNKTDVTAYHRFNNHYYNAVTSYNEAINTTPNGLLLYEAYKELGMAIHYLSDLNTPHHAANRIAVLSCHLDYEKWVDNNRNSYLVNTAPEDSYNYVKNRTFRDMADGWSRAARAQIDNADRRNSVGAYDNSTAGIATEECFKRSQRAAAALLYRFITDTGRTLPNIPVSNSSQAVRTWSFDDEKFDSIEENIVSSKTVDSMLISVTNDKPMTIPNKTMIVNGKKYERCLQTGGVGFIGTPSTPRYRSVTISIQDQSDIYITAQSPTAGSERSVCVYNSGDNTTKELIFGNEVATQVIRVPKNFSGSKELVIYGKQDIRIYEVTAVNSPANESYTDDYSWRFDRSTFTNTQWNQTNPITVDGLTCLNGVSVGSSSKTLNGVKYTHFLNLSGTGTEEKNEVYFNVSGNTEITIAALSGGSETRTLQLINSYGLVIGEMAVENVNGTIKEQKFLYTGGDSYIRLRSTDSGIRIFRIDVSKQSGH